MTKEGVHLSNESLKGLRRAKEFAREHGGAHNVIVNKSMRAAVRSAHAENLIRKKEEENKKLEKKRSNLQKMKCLDKTKF